MLDGSINYLNIPTEVLSLLERPTLISVKPLRAMFDLAMSTFSAEVVLKEEDKRELRNPILNQDAESLHKIDRDARPARYASTKKLLIGYINGDSGWVWTVNRRTELDVWLG